MKPFITFLLIVFLTSFIGINAQTVLLDESFNNNNFGWNTGRSGKTDRDITGGKYVWDASNSGLVVFFETHDLAIDFSQDFTIEATVTKVRGKDDHWDFGFYWGTTSTRFSIYGGEGTYSRIPNIYSGIASSYIVKGNGTNKMKVKKEGNKYKYYINGNYVDETDYVPVSGKTFGLYFYISDQKLEIDDVRVTQSPSSAPAVATSGSMLLDENFSNNNYGWSTSYSGSPIKKIEDGKYKWIASSEYLNSYFETHTLNIDFSRDFVIEAQVTKISGRDDHWNFGFYWGNTSTRFTIYGGEGTYSRIPNIYSGIKSSFVNSYNATNKLTLKKVGNMYKFYMNDNYLDEYSYTTLSGSDFGLYFYISNQVIEVDYIKVYYGGSSSPSTPPAPSNVFVPMSKLVTDDFSDNLNSWFEVDDASAYIKVLGGKYIFQYKKESGSYLSYNTFNELDENRDFKIESSMKIVSGSDKSLFGLYYGAKDLDNGYMLCISSAGEVVATKVQDGKYVSFPVNFEKSSYVNTGIGSTNKITLSREGNDMKIYINDNFFKSITFESFFGKKIGFNVEGLAKVEFDYIYISGYKK